MVNVDAKEELRKWSGHSIVMLGQPETCLNNLKLGDEISY